jgi:hypothetical protein
MTSPWTRPISAASTTESTTASQMLMPPRWNSAIMTPAKPDIAPTDRSMSPAKITNITPSAIIEVKRKFWPSPNMLIAPLPQPPPQKLETPMLK